ncbi:immunity 53 family protein [Hyphomonas sp.]|uniref:immunity 53 family protein n=1 Tax=Hyphomonas sp. TaxID=87 RepID=UPI0039E5A313
MPRWYQSQCDGDWEHSFGLKIESLDNPGWSVHVDLEGTSLETRDLQALSLDRSETDWLHYRREAMQFFGACGSMNLSELLECFRSWAKGGIKFPKSDK